LLLLDGILLGLVAGLAAGGSLRHLGNIHLRGEALMLLLLIAQFLIPVLAERLEVPKSPALAAWLLTMAGLVLLALWNRHVTGMLLVAIGISLNVLVIGFNSGMPVSLEAVNWLNPGAAPVFDLLHNPLTERTVLAVLADVVPVPGPSWHRGVASIGDFALLFGVALFIHGGMRSVSDAG
jgi:hypothetical protein